jgi:hypothetical protein
MLRKLILIGTTAAIVCVSIYGVTHWQGSRRRRQLTGDQEHSRARDIERRSKNSPASLDAHGFSGIHEITKQELMKLMSRFRPLSQDEIANLDRGCPGFVCLYQGLGETRWPESAHGTVAYRILADALKRQCPNGQENFIFVKQGWWLSGHPPNPNPTTGQVSVNSVTRIKPGWYTFNYAVYFPDTSTYAWINHREYGFPVNLVKPQKAFLSLSSPPLNESGRKAQIYCSTCR